MIIKIVVAIGALVTIGAWLLVLPFGPEATQKSMPTSASLYRDLGLLPAPGQTIISKDIGHGVFEVPASDKLRLQAGMQAMAAMNAGDMAEPKDDDHAEDASDMTAMKDDDHAEDAGDMAEAKDEDHAAEAEAGHDGGEGLTIIRTLGVAVDKTINIDMDDWGYNLEHAMVMKGETVRLVVTNKGNTPHEFMLMSMAGMQGVNYRIQRADWNLLEHEALFEVPIMMPGDSVEAVVKIEDSGMWMFMCMFPYHMELGMMGMMMTPDRMGSMGSM